jgi:hypothetical protein
MGELGFAIDRRKRANRGVRTMATLCNGHAVAPEPAFHSAMTGTSGWLGS